MKIESLFIAGIGHYFPPPASVRQAVAEGRYPAEEAAQTQLESVLVAEHETAPDMAIHAARDALARAAIDPGEIALLLHAGIFFQGLYLYPIASYIHRALSGHSALAVEVNGVSNGGLACLELAAAYLAAAPDRTEALITTADRFGPPLLDRWRCDTGMVMGDGASAMVLSRRDGFARVLSIATASDPSLEQLHRGDEPFAPAPVAIDVHRRKREYLSKVGLHSMVQRFRAGLRAATDRALRESGTELAEIARFALPYVGRILLEREYFDELRIPDSITTWQYGRRIGHLGAGDQITGLGLLMDHGALKPGDRCMMMGVGAGFTWSCAVVEILQPLPLRPHPLFT